MGLLNPTHDWEKHWIGMPEFAQKDLRPNKQLLINFQSPEDVERFAERIGVKIHIGKTRSLQNIWWPPVERMPMQDKVWVTKKPVLPRHPVYIISKGRWESRLTARALDMMGVPFRIVVEPQEADNYAKVVGKERMLVLPFSNLGQGSIPARNWVWEHSISEGASWHWILDDNIRMFKRLWRNTRRPVRSGVCFRVIEDFVDRYENVGQAGMHYEFLRPRKYVWPPYILNTRAYSCILNRNDIEHRWRGRYNEDTDLSLRILKDGWCIVLFNAFLAQKSATLTMKGGNTDELYKQDSNFDGRYEMAKSLVDQHPDVVRMSKKWGRWQHHVDYSKWEKRKLKLKKHALLRENEVDDYGMYLVAVNECTPLLIGQAPGKGWSGDPEEILCGKVGKRLAKLMGISFERYQVDTERVNLLDVYPGKDKGGKGDAWPKRKAESKATEMLPLLEDKTVVFLGRNVADAFGFSDLSYLQWRYGTGVAERVAVIPHPSGIVRWWNDARNRKEAQRFLSAIFSDTNQEDEECSDDED